MDKGTFAKNGYEVRPGQNGSYVLLKGGRDECNWHGPREVMGFTTAFDLLAFLKEDHTAHFTNGPEPSTE